MDIQLEERAPLEVAWREDKLPERMVVVQAKGYAVNSEYWRGRLYQPLASTGPAARTPVNLVAIPYYAWAHRGLDGMRIWIPWARV
jgi:DUF1680 family protein